MPDTISAANPAYIEYWNGACREKRRTEITKSRPASVGMMTLANQLVRLVSPVWEAIRKNGNTPKTAQVTVRGEIQAGGTQLKVSGINEVFQLKATSALQQQLNA